MMKKRTNEEIAAIAGMIGQAFLIISLVFLINSGVRHEESLILTIAMLCFFCGILAGD